MPLRPLRGRAPILRLRQQFIAELPDGHPLRIRERYKLESVVEVVLVADNRPHGKRRRESRKREAQLHDAPNRNWRGQVCAEPTLGDDETVAVPGTLFVVTNPERKIGAITRKPAAFCRIRVFTRHRNRFKDVGACEWSVHGCESRYRGQIRRHCDGHHSGRHKGNLSGSPRTPSFEKEKSPDTLGALCMKKQN
jgi:hypothetical protein